MNLKRLLKKIKLQYIRRFNSTWICSYKTNLSAFKKGSFFCPQKKFEDVENYALCQTMHFKGGQVKLSFRKTNIIDHIRNIL